MSFIVGFRCNCCSLIFDLPAYIGEEEVCPVCYCDEFTAFHQEEDEFTAFHQEEDAEDAEN